MIHIFTYGSLMFDEIWSGVVEGTYDRLDGTLFGFERKSIRNEHYPAVIPGPITSSVEGVLYLDIQKEDLLRLDSFEGSFYRRQTVQIQTDNNIFAAEAYILDPSYRHVLSDETWDPKRFEAEGIQSFISSYFGFDL